MKDINNLPRGSPETVKHFDKMVEVMECRPITKPTNVLA